MKQKHVVQSVRSKSKIAHYNCHKTKQYIHFPDLYQWVESGIRILQELVTLDERDPDRRKYIGLFS